METKIAECKINNQDLNLEPLYNLKKSQIAGIIDTDKKKTKMKMPVQNKMKILFFKDKKISKDDAIIVTTAAKLEVQKLLDKNSFKGPRFFLQ